jgi:hypothetical protein
VVRGALVAPTLEVAEVRGTRASPGERLRIHGRQVGEPTKEGEIIEVRGADGGPPYVVRFDDGHEGLVVPSSDCEIVPAAPSGD